MRHRTAAALAIAALLALGATACSSDDDSSDQADKPSAPAASTTLTAEQRDAAREAAGLPPRPDAATTTAYVAALDAIDKDIVHGKSEKAVDRGLNQCSSIKRTPNDRDALITSTNSRFTSPTHPDGHGPAKAEQILDVVHKKLCPTF